METKTITPPKGVNNFLYFWLGLIFLAANKIRYKIKGYTRPRDFDVGDIDRAALYDKEVFEKYKYFLKNCFGRDIDQATILELGPGADLGLGLLALGSGAKKYFAFDANKLAGTAPVELYKKLIKKNLPDLPDFEAKALLGEAQTASRDVGRLSYVVRRDFCLEPLYGQDIDVVLSHSAFEHFDDPLKTIKELSRVASPGAAMVLEIDLQTHSRGLRDRDPLNIYRYPKWLYGLLSFRGAPNRVRVDEYERALKENGWTDIDIFTENIVDNDYFQNVRNSLAKEFQGKGDSMKDLSVIVCARKLGS